MNLSELNCQEEHRREDVRVADLFGIDYLEVSEDQRQLEVYFLGRCPQQIDKANVRIRGGARVTDIRVTDLHIHRQDDATLDDRLEIDVDRFGDHSTYTLDFVEVDKNGYPTDQPLKGFDRRYSAIDFTFKASCPTDLDCKPEQICPPPLREQPEINYLAKDYASFRQLILDRLALIMPDWRERHAADIGIMLVELLAYVGDHLSYYQDAVATEAYLDTARQRISVRRHARLVDYRVHEGCNARAWVTVNTEGDVTLEPKDFYFCTAFPQAPLIRTLRHVDVEKLPPESYVAFSALLSAPVALRAAHNEIRFYTWGDCACCLPQGATSATLIDHWPNIKPKNGEPDGEKPKDDRPKDDKAQYQNVKQQGGPKEPKPGEPPGAVRALQLKVGDVLIFEEVVSPKTGLAADADPRHRQAVRLTKVECDIDPLYHPYGRDYGQPIVRIEWCPEDALTFPLCISAEMPPPECDCREGISVARGNVILVESCLPYSAPIGTVETRQSEEVCPTDCSPGETIVTPEKFRPHLPGRPLTFGEPLPPCACAIQMITQDPRAALPRVSLTGTLPKPEDAGDDFVPVSTTWTPRLDLLESGPSDPHFVVEIDDQGIAHLRFGDGDEGRMPDAGTNFTANYAIGNGPGGNVGAETINYIVFRNTADLGTLTPRNPLAAAGGTAAEPIAEVKMFAPHAFRARLERAITAADYAAFGADNVRRLAERAPPVATDLDCCELPFHRLQGANGALRWTGSWYEARVATDPLGLEDANAELFAEIAAYLDRYRRIGHDLNVALARFAPIDLGLTVCVQPHVLRGHVEAAIRDAFSSRVLPGGRLGFFHPDNLTFGGGIFLSQIIAAAQAVSSVMEVEVTRLTRYRVGSLAPDGKSNDVPASGVLPLAPYEIARLGSDLNFPENGRFTLRMRGGR